MTKVYTDADYLAIYKQRSRILGIFVGVTAFYLLVCIFLAIYHGMLPYASPYLKLPRILVCVLSGVYVATMFPYMMIVYHRVNRYSRMLQNVNTGIKSEEKNYFYSFKDKSYQQDNVDTVSVMFASWSRKRKEWQEREVYFDAEKPLPDFRNGDLIRYITQGNFIIEYEVVDREICPFEKKDEMQEFIKNMPAEE